MGVKSGPFLAVRPSDGSPGSHQPTRSLAEAPVPSLWGGDTRGVPCHLLPPGPLAGWHDCCLIKAQRRTLPATPRPFTRADLGPRLNPPYAAPCPNSHRHREPQWQPGRHAAVLTQGTCFQKGTVRPTQRAGGLVTPWTRCLVTVCPGPLHPQRSLSPLRGPHSIPSASIKLAPNCPNHVSVHGGSRMTVTGGQSPVRTGTCQGSWKHLSSPETLHATEIIAPLDRL